MNHEQLLATIGATAGVVLALLTMGLSRAPGYGELRWLGVITGAAGSMCALRLLAEELDDEETVRILVRVGLAMGGLLSYGWLRYEASETGRHPSRLDRALGATVLAFAALALIPSVALGQRIIRHGDGWNGARYVDVLPTIPGILVLAVLLGVPGLVLVRYVKRAGRGERGATAHALALGGILLAGLVDAIDGIWVHAWEHMIPIGLLWTIGMVSLVLVARFVEGARAMAVASGRLQETVTQRTVELASTQATLAETEQLATLGRLSAAVAHEINNPAAVVAANLSYLRDVMGSDDARPEEVAAIGDTLEAIDRIGRIVRQLGDAGERAVHGGTTAPIGLTELARAAVGSIRLLRQDRITIDVPESLFAISQEASLRQVLTSLVASALEVVHATSSEGPIVIRGERRGDRAQLRIEDPAPEVDDALRARRFAPFTAPRPTVVRGDVGLTVSVALLRMFGGDISVERTDDAGSVVCIDLRAGEAASPRSDAPVSSNGPRVRVLVVDDDALTRIGLRRLLGREYVVEEAGGVTEALARVGESGDEIDVVICDVVMPDGGAELLLAGLERTAPQLAKATVLLTGGAVDAQTEALVRVHAARVLRKPVDVVTLRAMVERVRRSRRQKKSSWNA